MTRAGFVGLAGRPNVGKSTLANAVVGSKIAIVSDRPQTTRRAVRGIATDPGREWQLVLVDLPGVQRPRDTLTARMQRRVEQELADADSALLVVDGQQGVGPGDRFIAKALLAAADDTHVVCAVNKCDRLGPGETTAALAAAAELDCVDDVFPVSAERGWASSPGRASGLALARGPVPLPTRGSLGSPQRGPPRGADPRAGSPAHPRGGPARRGGCRRGHRTARRRHGGDPCTGLGGDRVAEGDPDRSGGPRSGDGHRGSQGARARARLAGVPRPPGQGPWRGGAATRACWTASGSSSGTAPDRNDPANASAEPSGRGARSTSAGSCLRDAGLGDRRGADARLHERGGAAAHARDRRGALLQPLAGRDVAQGRDLGQRAARAADPLRLRRRRVRRPGRAGRARLPHGPALVLLPRPRGHGRPGEDAPPADGEPAPAAHEALPALERTLVDRRERRPGAPTRSSCWTTRSASATKVRRRRTRWPGPPRSESEERVAEEARRRRLPPAGAAALARGLDRRGAGDAQWPSQLSARPRSPEPGRCQGACPRAGTRSRSGMTFVDDCETPVSRLSQAARRRPLLPARVGRAGTARALLVPGLHARARCCATRTGAARVAAELAPDAEPVSAPRSTTRTAR